MGARYISRSSFHPGVHQYAKCTVGSATDMSATDQEGQVVLGTGLTSDLNTTGTFAAFYVPKGTVVTNVIVNKTVAASAANLSIGDTTDDDGFWPATDILSTATGVKNLKTQVSTAEAATLPAYAGARFYLSTADCTFDTDNMARIDVVVKTAALTTGKMDIYLEYFNDYELRLP